VSSDGPSSDRTRIIRRQPGVLPEPTPIDSAPTTAAPREPEPRTGIIRRHPTGAFPALTDATTITPVAEETQTSYIPRPEPDDVVAVRRPRPSPVAASATATVAIISGWATAVIATSLITNWWRTDELFCVAIGFLTAVSAAATIGGLIALLLRWRIGRLLIGVGAVVALMIFAGLFVAGASLPPVVYAIPALPLASIAMALLPATGRWCR
jgi:hypothetical protein